jgi:hypothetical protein
MILLPQINKFTQTQNLTAFNAPSEIPSAAAPVGIK